MQTVTIEDNVEITTTFRRSFEWKHERGSGFSFECDESGNVDPEQLNPNALQHWNAFINGEYDVVDKGIEKQQSRCRLCPCGSGQYPEDCRDARGIFVCRVCPACKKEKLSRYRPEIFSDMNYEANEPIEPDDY